MMKPRIFIGSSTEGLPVAERIKSYFSDDYDSFIWTDNIFKYNENFLETLMKSASLFDFGFMVFTADDKTKVREKLFDTARDNVMFEYGLFLGRIGNDRAYIVFEEGVKIPTDLAGITLANFKTDKNEEGEIVATNSLEESLGKLKRQIDEKVQLGYLGLLPSTVIAISYFENFVSLVADWIITNKPRIELNGKIYTDAKLKIIIPATLDADIKKQAKVYYMKHQCNQETVDTKHRSYPIHFTARGESEILEICDMPTILNGIDKAIDMYFRIGHIGKTNEQQLTEDRELGSFARVLKLLIEQDAYCKHCVVIEQEES